MYSTVIQYLYKSYSSKSYYKIMATIPVSYNITLFLTYCVHSHFYLLIPYPWLDPPHFLLPESACKSGTKNYSYGSTPMSRGKCLPRIKMEEGLWISGGQSAIYVTFNNYVFSFHCWVCYQILIQKPSSIFLTLTGIFVFLFLRGNIWKEAFRLFKVIFLFGLATWPPTWRGFLLLLWAFSSWDGLWLKEKA